MSCCLKPSLTCGKSQGREGCFVSPLMVTDKEGEDVSTLGKVQWGWEKSQTRLKIRKLRKILLQK